MKPFPNRTGVFQCIRLSIACELSTEIYYRQLKLAKLSEGIATVVLRLANVASVSLDGHYSIDYYDHSVPNRG